MNPLISVQIPCYNCANTLPMALASLMAQTYKNWECIIVNDGSIDDPEEIVKRIQNSRIRYIRQDHRGGGVARQVALRASRGDFIAFLDADDWWYPWKLERQVEFMKACERVAILGAGMAIVDATGHLVGVRGRGQCGQLVPRRMARLTVAPVAFGPCIVRREIALKAGFDAAFTVAQDADFLFRILAAGNAYCVLPEVMYVYTEYQTVSLNKMLAQGAFVRHMFWKQRGRFPIASRLQICEASLKSVFHRLVYACDRQDWLIRRRSSPPGEQEQQEFEKAQMAVLETKQMIFGADTDLDNTGADVVRSATHE
jgi:glycosyltransferase involved in cell wall biosynthesis